MKWPKFSESVGAIMALLVTLALVWIAVDQHNEIALGAVISTSAAAGGFFLRGKVQPPT